MNTRTSSPDSAGRGRFTFTDRQRREKDQLYALYLRGKLPVEKVQRFTNLLDWSLLAKGAPAGSKASSDSDDSDSRIVKIAEAGAREREMLEERFRRGTLDEAGQRRLGRLVDKSTEALLGRRAR